MKKIALAFIACAALAACQKKEATSEASRDAAAEAAPAPAETAAAPVAKSKASVAAARARPQTSVPLLAYVYTYALEAPAAKLTGLMHKHEQACADAGPAVCQVVGAHSTAEGRDDVSAELVLRAEPGWLGRFRSGLDGDARAAGGKVSGSQTGSEDLSRSIVDAEAGIRAKSVLRDRLQSLLAHHDGKLKDLLEVEHELADVQGEIDAAQSELTVMRNRVQMSTLTINYRSAAVLAPDNAFAPVSSAAGGALRLSMKGVGFLITLAALLAPVALIAGPAVWFATRRRKRRALPAPAEAGAQA